MKKNICFFVPLFLLSMTSFSFADIPGQDTENAFDMTTPFSQDHWAHMPKSEQDIKPSIKHPLLQELAENVKKLPDIAQKNIFSNKQVSLLGYTEIESVLAQLAKLLDEKNVYSSLKDDFLRLCINLNKKLDPQKMSRHQIRAAQMLICSFIEKIDAKRENVVKFKNVFFNKANEEFYSNLMYLSLLFDEIILNPDSVPSIGTKNKVLDILYQVRQNPLSVASMLLTIDPIVGIGIGTIGAAGLLFYFFKQKFLMNIDKKADSELLMLEACIDKR